ncbi:peptidyl-prolyl cis-trans isomerase [Uruburuella testudinis]|uniref:peptidylprolyl isomerase n=1 Tax=Uruburuella testudinis TaxID=1282863 RepID=A0ABY4DW57_9NEIS|nr:peptidyl-prolyl cis-trans isomerase [Uruburuella testudinis]UOO83268.1 peptidyl-prolyl cis-trans isomerase [Uruburuella testudinis]
MQKTRLASALMLLTLSGSLLAQTLVTVNGTKIDSKTIDDQVKMLQSQSNGQLQNSPALRQNLLQRQVGLTLVGQEAKRLKLDQSNEYKQALAQARDAAKQQGADKQPMFKQEWAAYERELLNQAYMADVLRKNPVSDSDARSAYNEFSNFYKGSQEVQMGEIVTRSKADADKAIADLKARKSFKTVAAQYTIDPQAKQNGGIPANYVRLKDLEQGAPAIYAAVKDLKKGAYTPAPLQDNNGLFAVLYINDKRAVKVPSFEEAKPALLQDLQAARVDAAVQALYQKADIKPAK